MRNLETPTTVAAHGLNAVGDADPERFKQAFDIEGIIRAADPHEVHPVLVIDCTTLEVLGANSAVSDTFGYSTDQLVGHTPSKLHISAEKYRAFRRLVRSSQRRGQAALRCHYPLRRRDGRAFPAEVMVTFVREILQNRMVYVCETRDLSRFELEPCGKDGGLNIRGIAGKLPGALFQRLHAPDGNVQYTFLRGPILDRLGVDANAVKDNAEFLLDRLHPDDRGKFFAAMDASAKSRSVADVDLRLFTDQREVVHVRSLSQPRQLDDGTTIWEGMFLDVTDEHDAQARNHALAYQDQLTGLPNLAGFRRVLDRVLSERTPQSTSMVLVAINIKRLHLINQTYGVEMTNKLIRRVGKRLRDHVNGDAGRIGRTHRGEYLLLFNDIEAGVCPFSIGPKLTALFDEPFTIDGADGSSVRLQPSVGLVVCPEHGRTSEELVFHLDAALNRARVSGQRHVYYSDDIIRSIRDELHLERELRAAIDAGEIRPHYQPQIDLRTGSIAGFEALARWTTADGRSVSPLQFISLAEQAGLVGELGRSMIRQVIQDIKRMPKSEAAPPVAVSINISGLHLDEDDFEAWYLDALREAGLGVESILLEVTESTFMLDFDRAQRQMRRLHDAGVRFSMDDFGTGYSSLSYLTQLPFDMIKIDRSFVQDIERDRHKQALVKSVIHIANALNLQVIAEGVETEKQKETLKALGCQQAKGYYFGRPAPAEIALRF